MFILSIGSVLLGTPVVYQSTESMAVDSREMCGKVTKRIKYDITVFHDSIAFDLSANFSRFFTSCFILTPSEEQRMPLTY